MGEGEVLFKYYDSVCIYDSSMLLLRRGVGG
jgi:hypothetical protein